MSELANNKSIRKEVQDLGETLGITPNGKTNQQKIRSIGEQASDGTYATKEYVNTLMSGALKRAIVETLPTENIDTNTIYMVLDQSASQQGNVYNEYLYINNAWELIGTTEVAETVIANPTLAGTEADLTGLEVGGVKYKVPQGSEGSGVEFVPIDIKAITINQETLEKLVDFNNRTLKPNFIVLTTRGETDTFPILMPSDNLRYIYRSAVMGDKYYQLTLNMLEMGATINIEQISVGGGKENVIPSWCNGYILTYNYTQMKKVTLNMNNLKEALFSTDSYLSENISSFIGQSTSYITIATLNSETSGGWRNSMITFICTRLNSRKCRIEIQVEREPLYSQEHTFNADIFSWEDVFDFLANEPAIVKINLDNVYFSGGTMIQESPDYEEGVGSLGIAVRFGFSNEIIFGNSDNQNKLYGLVLIKDVEGFFNSILEESGSSSSSSSE